MDQWKETEDAEHDQQGNVENFEHSAPDTLSDFHTAPESG
jgi:hypothetical protein